MFLRVERGDLIEFNVAILRRLCFKSRPHKALGAQTVDQLTMLALSTIKHGGKKRKPAAFAQGEQFIHHFRNGLTA